MARWWEALFHARVERERRRRLRALDERIEAAPASYTHLVLRGELHLERAEYGQAVADFEVALELIAGLDDAKGWQIIEQIMRDRALFGINQAARRLPNSGGQRHAAILEA